MQYMTIVWWVSLTWRVESYTGNIGESGEFARWGIAIDD